MKCFICKKTFEDTEQDSNRIRLLSADKQSYRSIRNVRIATKDGVKRKPVCAACGNLITMADVISHNEHRAIFEDQD